MMFELIGAMSWKPGFAGILTVAVAVAILCGAVFLILATNSGTRLGFLIALTGLFGWLFVMGIIWTIYGIGWKGDAPTWKVVDTVVGDPSESKIEKVESLPLPEEMPDPVERRDSSDELLELFPPEQRDPTRGDLVTADEEFEEQINEDVAPWAILETSNKYTGETQSVVAEDLGPDGEGLFESASDYVVLDTYTTGGKSKRSDDSIVGRVLYKFTSAFEFGNDPFYAVVQIQPVIQQETKPGQAPPTPVADPNTEVVSVVLERDRGNLRVPAGSFMIFSGIVFAVCASSLHRRDKLAIQQRAAVAGAA